MARYTFEDGAHFHNKDDADAQAIGDELERLTTENDGRLQPVHVVEAARKRSSPLHRHFDWNDKTAAEQFRLEQARQLVRSVRIIGTSEDHRAVRAYYSIQDHGVSYRTVDEVQSSAMLQEQLHKQALRDLLAWMARYREITELCALIKPVVGRAESLVASWHETVLRADASASEEARPH